jgi:hypothetical protein
LKSLFLSQITLDFLDTAGLALRLFIEELSDFVERNYPLAMERLRRFDKEVLVELEQQKSLDKFKKTL